MLTSAEGKTISVPTTDARKLAYKLREALYIIDKHPRLYTEFSSLVNKFRIKTKTGSVELVPKESLDYETPIFHLADSFKLLEIPEAEDAIEIIGAIIKHKAPKFIFPGFDSNSEEWQVLTLWLADSDYRVETKLPLTIVKNGEVHNQTDD